MIFFFFLLYFNITFFITFILSSFDIIHQLCSVFQSISYITKFFSKFIISLYEEWNEFSSANLQFIGMLLHRFGTMAHIIASTQLFCWRKRVDHLTEDELVVQNAVEIARELQAIRGVDEPDINAPSVYLF